MVFKKFNSSVCFEAVVMSQKIKASPKPSPKNTLFNYFSRNSLNTSQNVEKSAEKELPAVKKDVQEKLTGKKLDFGK